MSGMAQWVKVFVTEPEDWSLIPRIHVVEGGN